MTRSLSDDSAIGTALQKKKDRERDIICKLGSFGTLAPDRRWTTPLEPKENKREEIRPHLHDSTAWLDTLGQTYTTHRCTDPTCYLCASRDVLGWSALLLLIVHQCHQGCPFGAASTTHVMLSLHMQP